MDCFNFAIDFGAELRSSMANLQLSGTNRRTSNSGIGPSNVPVEPVQSRLERELPEVSLPSDSNDNEEEIRFFCEYHARRNLLGSSHSSEQTSESVFSHVDPRFVGGSNVTHGLAFFNSLTTSDIAHMAMFEKWCSYFQYMLLGVYGPIIREKIVRAVIEDIVKLMLNPYGYVLFHFILRTSTSMDEFGLIFAKMSESLIKQSKTEDGSSSVMMLIHDFRHSSLIRLITAALAEEVFTLMTHQTGKKVIYMCFSLLDSRKREVLSTAVAKQCIKLSTHVLGCRSINECLEFIIGAPGEHLLDTIAQNSFLLAKHSKGNYVLQHVLRFQNPIINDKICSLLYGHYVYLSSIKTGSHVVETCLDTSGIHYVIDEFVASNKILDLAKDEHGNYVIQRALSRSKVNAPGYHRRLLSYLIHHIRSLQRHPFGKIVCGFIKKEFPAAME